MNIKSKQGNEVRESILKFLREKQVTISPASIREITDAVGCVSTSVTAYHLGVLEKEGRIQREHKKARNIVLVKGK